MVMDAAYTWPAQEGFPVGLERNLKGTAYGMLFEAVASGLLAEKLDGSTGFLATDPKNPWFPKVIGWETTRTRLGSTLTSSSAHYVTGDKLQTKRLLELSGIAGVPFQVFQAGKSGEDAARAWAERVEAPLVVKPRFGDQGKGVTVDVSDSRSFAHALKNLGRQGFGGQDFIVEQYVAGFEYRFIASPEKTFAVYRKFPAFVVGDGKRTVAQLAGKRLSIRQRREPLADSRAWTDIPEVGEPVRVSLLGNVSQGAQTLVVTDEVHSSLLELGARAVAAIPGLDYGGVDVILSGGHHIPLGEQTVAILEINSRAGTKGVHSPTFGPAQNLSAEIVRDMARRAQLAILSRPQTIEVVGNIQAPQLSLKKCVVAMRESANIEVAFRGERRRLLFRLEGPTDNVGNAIMAVDAILRLWGGSLVCSRLDVIEDMTLGADRDLTRFEGIMTSPFGGILGGKGSGWRPFAAWALEALNPWTGTWP